MAAALPCCAASVRGKPTTTSTTSCSATSSVRRSMSLPERSSRDSVTSGVARIGAGSLIATPTRTEPTSTPSLRPGPGSPWPGLSGSVTARPRPLRGAGTLRRLRSTGALRGLASPASVDGSLRRLRSRSRLVDRPAERTHRVGYARRVAAAALREVGLAAATAADRGRERGHELARRQARVPRRRRGRDHEVDLLAGRREQRHDTRPVAEPVADLARELAQVVAADAVRRRDRHERGAADVLRLLRERARRGQQLPRPQLLQLLLRRAQPLDGLAD